MTVESTVSEYTLPGVAPFPVAVTTVDGDRTEGAISLSSCTGGSLSEIRQVTIRLDNGDPAHDMVLRSGVLAAHWLALTPERAMKRSLDIIRRLGECPGRDGGKLAPFTTKRGLTGAPILLDALGYAEGRVVDALDDEGSTLFLADVVAAERFGDGEPLRFGAAWTALSEEWPENALVSSPL